jgi:hypothetical protein
MNSQDFRNLQEAYLSVYEQEESLDEGIGSAIKGLFTKKKKPEAPEPLSRGAQLRQKYGTETSPKRQILDKTRERAEKDEKEYGDSPYSKSVAIKSRKTHDDYLKGGYSKYGAGEGSGGQGGSGGRGGGNAARRRAEKLNNSYDLYDIILSHLLDEGYADTEDSALVIMANMSEDWRESICEDYKPWDFGPKQKAKRKYDQLVKDKAAGNSPPGTATRANKIASVAKDMRNTLDKNSASTGTNPAKQGLQPATQRHTAAALRGAGGGMTASKAYDVKPLNRR